QPSTAAIPIYTKRRERNGVGLVATRCITTCTASEGSGARCGSGAKFSSTTEVSGPPRLGQLRFALLRPRAVSLEHSLLSFSAFLPSRGFLRAACEKPGQPV